LFQKLQAHQDLQNSKTMFTPFFIKTPPEILSRIILPLYPRPFIAAFLWIIVWNNVLPRMVFWNIQREIVLRSIDYEVQIFL
jgi:hypothetical protein